MDIWIATSRKPVTCTYCNEVIPPNSAVVFGRLWKNYNEEGHNRRWVGKFYWHAQKPPDLSATGTPDLQSCYILQGLERLKSEVKYLLERDFDKPIQTNERQDS